jgi:hypothetical protein
MRAIGAGAASRVAECAAIGASKNQRIEASGVGLMAKDTIDASADDRRHDPRFVVNLPAHVTIRGDRVLCKLVDISLHGALVETAGPVHVGDKVSLDLPNIGPTIATVLRITPTHMAMVFPGAVVISSLLPKD